MLRTKQVCSYIVAGVMTLTAGVNTLFANDWPMWRCDDHRSGITSEQLPDPLYLQWTRQLPSPAAAWDNQKEEYNYGGPGLRQPQMVSYDVGYQPVVAGNYMYFGSPNNDCMTQVDITTGQIVHKFYAAGPIRFAPIVKNGKVFFGADDGYIYCLDATNLTLITKISCSASPRKVMGNDRLVSIWPVRGGAVMSSSGADSNWIYFACGLYAFEGSGVFCYNAVTGDRKWINDGSSIYYTINPHSTADGLNGIAPQGYLCLADSNKLLVPNGRAVPACFDRLSGKMLYNKLGQTGGGGYFVSSKGNYFYNFSTSCNLSTGASSGSTPAQYNGRNLQITAGTTVYASSSTFDTFPSYTVTGGSFSVTYNSMPTALVAANGRLFVTTKDGTIYCYGGTPVQTPTVYQYETVPPQVDGATSFAGQILNNCAYKQGSKGICLVVGLTNGRLAEEMTLQSDLTVIAIDPDQSKIDLIRARLDAEGNYGRKVHLICGDMLSAGLPPYFASLIISENVPSGFALANTEENINNYVATMYNSLRPFGGQIILEADKTFFTRAIAAKNLKNASVNGMGTYTLVQKVGALPGTADWNSQYANSSHTNFVKDSLVKGPMGVLWFGGSADNINNGMADRHGHGSVEQVCGGHYYMQGINKLRCVDAYTGRVQWEHQIQNFGSFSDYTEHEAGYTWLGDNFVSLPDAVYALGEHDINQFPKVCYVLDPATGATKSTITMPDSLGAWGLLSICDSVIIATSEPLKFDKDTIVPPGGNGWVSWYATGVPIGVGGISTMNGAFTQHIVAFNRFTGEKLWDKKAEKGFFNLGIASGNGKVFAIDKLSKAAIGYINRMGLVDTVAGTPKVKCFDIHTGNVIWIDSVNAFARYLAYNPDHDVLLEGSRTGSDAMTGEPSASKMIAFNGTTGAVNWIYNTPSPSYYGGPYILNDTLIYTQSSNAFGCLELNTGKWHRISYGLTDKLTDYYQYRHYGCNYGLGATNVICVRSGSGSYIDLQNNSGLVNWGGFKTGCTPSLVPANGLVINSEYTRTCSCNYQVQTSCAMVYDPNIENWAMNQGLATKFATQGGKLSKVGVALGAPGNRRDTTGALWTEYPYGAVAAGFSGVDLPLTITVTGDSVSYYRHHPSEITAPELKFVAASGVVGASSIALKMIYDSLSGSTVIPTPITTDNYKVKLVFAETDFSVAAGQRVFDVSVNGIPVASGLDVLATTGHYNQAYIVEVPNVSITDMLTVTLTPHVGKPMLSGFSAIKM